MPRSWRIYCKQDTNNNDTVFEVSERLLYDTNVFTPPADIAARHSRAGGNPVADAPMHELVQTVNEVTGHRSHRFLNGPQTDMVLVDEVFNSTGTPTDILWLLHDRQNTVTDVATLPSTSGQATHRNHLEYNAFGEITSQTNSTYAPLQTYIGQILDPTTGLLFYDARWYDPKLGRFVSEDPIGFAAGDANLFRYVGNSWLNATDPTGLREPSPDRGVWTSGNSQSGTFRYHDTPRNGPLAGQSVRFEGGHVASGGFPASAYATGSAGTSTVTLDDISGDYRRRAITQIISEGNVPADFNFRQYDAHHAGPPGSMEIEFVHKDMHRKVAHEGTGRMLRKPTAGGPLDSNTCPARTAVDPRVSGLGRSIRAGGLFIIDIVDTARTAYDYSGAGGGTVIGESVRFTDQNGDVFIVEKPLWGAPRRRYVEGSRNDETAPISESELADLEKARDELYGKLTWDGRGWFESGTWTFTPGVRSPATLPIYDAQLLSQGITRRIGYVDETGEHYTPICDPGTFERENVF
jgi:RHS repeat-associated protein